MAPPKWASFAQLGAHFAASWERYVAQFVVWTALFTFALSALGMKPREFLPAFVFLYILSLVIFVIGQWAEANTYDLEPPLVALLLGLAISNLAARADDGLCLHHQRYLAGRASCPDFDAG